MCIRDRFFLFLICLFLPSNSAAQSAPKQFSSTVEAFFKTWLLNHNVEAAASQYLASNPVLGNCMIPKKLEGRKKLSRAQILRVWRKAIEVSLRKFNRGQKLSDFITSKDADMISDDAGIKLTHPASALFVVYKLKPFDDVKDNGFVCKFDERRSFLTQVSQPNLFYVLTRFKFQQKYQDFILITVWKKQSGRWRILTFSVTTDDS